MSSKLLLPLILLSLVPAACDINKPPELTAGGGGMDMFSPVKMRLHPLSRVVASGDKNASTPPTIEAHLEFTDQFNDVTKSPGELYFELYRYEPLHPSHQGRRIHLWNFELNTPQSNKEHWDPITRTYMFKLPLPANALKDQTRVVLTVTMTPITTTPAERLTDDIVLNLK